MRKIYFVVLFLLISILAGCKDEAVQVSLSDETAAETTADRESPSDALIYVYISGAVKSPGVYPVKEGTRIFSLIEMAGGFTKKARRDCLNQAEPVSDGQTVHVMSKREYQRSKSQSGQTGDETPREAADKKININTASEQELMTLPGIGQVKAAAIMEYREKNGNFTDVEKIKDVSGIGDSTFSKLEGMITIN